VKGVHWRRKALAAPPLPTGWKSLRPWRRRSAGAGAIRTLDQADAAILAMSGRAALERWAIGLIEEAEEGCFALPLQAAQALALGLTDTVDEPQGLTFGQQIGPFMSAQTDAVDAHRLR
jgi:hypothetical protein